MVIRWLIPCRQLTTGLSPRCSMAPRPAERITPSQPGHYSDRLLGAVAALQWLVAAIFLPTMQGTKLSFWKTNV